jgi:hypothetical protein
MSRQSLRQSAWQRRRLSRANHSPPACAPQGCWRRRSPCCSGARADAETVLLSTPSVELSVDALSTRSLKLPIFHLSLEAARQVTALLKHTMTTVTENGFAVTWLPKGHSTAPFAGCRTRRSRGRYRICRSATCAATDSIQTARVRSDIILDDRIDLESGAESCRTFGDATTST